MADMDDIEESSLRAGLVTPPPLSPTKSDSTCNWSAPSTPWGSPRKAKSCFSFRDTTYDLDLPLSPSSPTRFSGDASYPLSSPNGRKAEIGWELFAFKSTSLEQPQAGSKSIPQAASIYSTRSSSPPDLSKLDHSNRDPTASPLRSSAIEHSEHHFRSTILQTDGRIPIDSQDDSCGPSGSTTPVANELSSTFEASDPEVSMYDDIEKGNPFQLSRIPIRSSSSPLRSTQWAARGGLLSPTRSQSQTPDRFVSSRRPPYVTRQSFELNKPSSRLAEEESLLSGRPRGSDPFSRRLRRSGRMNAELRSLQQAHSALTSRASIIHSLPNVPLRRNSSILGTRQVSAGSVWNVGGSSVVTDTVAGVYAGRAGYLGAGTNAPLYTSSFLNSSDPDAELEAYEGRIALALDVDMAARILGHSTTADDTGGTNSPKSGVVQQGSTKHVWKDNEWAQEGHIPRLFHITRYIQAYSLTGMM
ncbi:hypothetical protein BU24DRAFT_142262 [Aaosphaeria arxii CBS 175.79]|uniref:Uncharacterized protein n=1 Tax=Aaosphaeria arxii CBS 175.79 TaxID=1450172 RepID=A0A6A5XVP5_9PLEO|nr:uncharacterized protein BU24DRAFT_142262 [Aaosphaeria arxii CBS 175.79]KAF2017029.1 hypothetical protein BU24DRAFT_142262 [Aaosphaeria arxii CBS 175.79]